MLTWISHQGETIHCLVLVVERHKVRCFNIDNFCKLWIDDYMIDAWAADYGFAFRIIRDGNVIYKGASEE